MPNLPTTPALRHELSRTFEDPRYRPPPLPSVALELLALSSRRDVEIEDVVRVLERDQMLAGSVMRLAGSSIYAGRGAVRSLREAVLRLGVRTVRDTVFETALKRAVFDVPSCNEIMARINRHGTATAYLTRFVCRYARVGEDQAFLCGLLHDVGFAALLFAAANQKQQILPPLDQIWEEIDALHEQASKIVTKLWGLPSEITLIVSNHHHDHTGRTSRLAGVVKIADFLSERFDAHVLGPLGADGVPRSACRIDPVAVEDSCSVLGLNAAALDRIAADAAPVLSVALGAL
jgi:HD-like signal output (HDOD) protein